MFRHKRHRRRNRYKRNTKIVVASFSLLVLFISVGYAAFSTNIDLHIKGNVKPSLTPEELKTLTVSSGDGLYDNGDNTYTYKGANPHNYITLGSDTYRIMGIDENNNLKVIKDESIGNIIWDPGYATSISGVTETNSVSGTRYSNNQNDYCYQNNGEEDNYLGCKLWSNYDTTLDSNGNVLLDKKIKRVVGSSNIYNLPSDESYINVFLNGGVYQGITYNGWVNQLPNTLSSLIENHLFNIGPVYNAYITDQSINTAFAQERSYTWRGKVGLITASDYVMASTNRACTSIRAYAVDSTCYSEGSTHNYLTKNYDFWTLTSTGSSYEESNIIIRVTSYGSLNNGYFYPFLSRGVRPVFYLSSNIRLIGTGTSDNPYEIKS